MSIYETALKMHEEWNGKLDVVAKAKVNSREDLQLHIHQELRNLVR